MSVFEFAAVGCGGAIGAMARYAANCMVVATGSALYVATLGVNIVGCFAIGVCLAWMPENVSHTTKLFFVTGVLGGFTTFSAFGFEIFEMLRDNGIALAAGYIALSVGLGVAAAAGGFYLIAGRPLMP